jgi:hypothetical protein
LEMEGKSFIYMWEVEKVIISHDLLCVLSPKSPSLVHFHHRIITRSSSAVRDGTTVPAVLAYSCHHSLL